MDNQDKQDFLYDLSEILETDVSALSEDFQITQGQMDSLAVVSLVSRIHLRFGVVPSGKQIEKCRSVREMISLIDAAKKKV
jgi:acyl carrier protein